MAACNLLMREEEMKEGKGGKSCSQRGNRDEMQLERRALVQLIPADRLHCYLSEHDNKKDLSEQTNPQTSASSSTIQTSCDNMSCWLSVNMRTSDLVLVSEKHHKITQQTPIIQI